MRDRLPFAKITSFQGYCEGVVGRFKGALVQIHGKLKKPVLMRRSGVGSIRDSTTQPMSKAEAASMHVSQVPLGIPISAIDSDDEEGGASPSGFSTDSRQRTASPAGNNVSPSSRTLTAPTNRINRLGVSTPPLSDDSHARQHQRKPSETDSDDSDTQLPWARSSLSSTKSSRAVSTDYTHETSHTKHEANNLPTFADNQKLFDLQRKDSTSQFPPSPISSAESPLKARPQEGINLVDSRSTIPRIRAPGQGHTSNQSSIATTATSTTSESEEDSTRREQTFSIYDVYGRDSVAFPNFDFRNFNSRTGRLATAKSSESLSVKSNSPLMQSAAMRGVPAMPQSSRSAIEESGQGLNKPIPSALRSPSGRRPQAAPALGTSMASSIRRKVEANAGASPASSPSASPVVQENGSASAFGTFDPMRRPSLGGAHIAGRPNLPNIQTGVSAPLSNAMPRSPISPISSIPQQSAAQPLGTNLLARRVQEASLNNKSNIAPSSLHVDTMSSHSGGSNASSPYGEPQSSGSLRSPVPRAMMHDAGAKPSPTFPPVRSSSELTAAVPTNGRIGSGQLRKNPSNPQPGQFGGNINSLVAPHPPYANNGGLSTPTGSSRSPSPLSHPSPSSRGSPGFQSASPVPLGGNRMPVSPIGYSAPGGPPQPRGPSQGPVPGYRGVNPANLKFDSLGFVMGSSFPLPVPNEDAEEIKHWRQVLREDDLAGARKSRKIKKMVQSGIPHSMRMEVWPFLANSSVRRRVGLFEELCKTSRSTKGKKGKELFYEAIDKDLDRAFPDHRLFIGEASTGRADLEAILKAYVHYNPIIGYTQGMSLVAGFLLILMPAEEAFWMLCALLRDVHMEGYYANTMKQLHVDGIVFGQLLQSMDSELAVRMTELRVEPINFTPTWFLPMFVRIVPWQTLLRLWDVFLFEGPSFILRTALGIIRIIKDPLMDRRVCAGTPEALRLLMHPPQNLLTPENVVPCALSVKLKDGDVRKMSRQASVVVRTTFNNSRGGGLPSSSAGPGINGSQGISAAALKRN
jgi:hypothetical protein